MTTSRDIARGAGVSQTTVSRVLQGSRKVSDAVRERVHRVMAEMNYRPNATARAMKSQRTGTIGVIVARITNPFYPQLLDHLSKAITATGSRAVVWDAEAGGEPAAIIALREGVVDGLVHGAATTRSAELAAVITQGLPVVLINRQIAGHDVDQVVSDNARGARQLADYFVDHQRHRIAVIGGPSDISTFRLREQAFITRLRHHSIQPAGLVRVPAASYHTGRSAMKELLQSAKAAQAVFCVNDVLALGAIDAARSAGVDIPGRLWIAGYDDVDMASWTAFDLTTVRQPMASMAQRAVERLFTRLAAPGSPALLTKLPGELIVRGSTGGAALESRSDRRS